MHVGPVCFKDRFCVKCDGGGGGVGRHIQNSYVMHMAAVLVGCKQPAL